MSRTTSEYPQSVGDLDGYSNESRPREPRHRSDNSALFGLGRDSSMRRGRPTRVTNKCIATSHDATDAHTSAFPLSAAADSHDRAFAFAVVTASCEKQAAGVDL